MDDFEFGDKLDTRKKLEGKMPGATNLVMILIVLIGAIVSLGEFSLTLTGVVTVTMTVAVMYVIASIIYKNCYSEGMIREKDTEEYKAVKAEYDAAIKDIFDSGILMKMPEYCLRYRAEELESCRAAILIDCCIDYKTYKEKYLGKTEEELRVEKLTEDAIRCILAANRMRGMNVTAGMLMSTGEETTLFEKLLRLLGIRRTFGMESKTRQQIDFGTNMVSRFITTFLAGAVGITVVMDDFSLRTIALWAMKMLPVAIAALSGTNSGKHNVTDTLIPQLQRKTKIIRIILGWSRDENEKGLACPQGGIAAEQSTEPLNPSNTPIKAPENAEISQ